MNETPGNASDEERIINLELNGVVELLTTGCQHGIEAVGLRNGSWESIKDEARKPISILHA